MGVGWLYLQVVLVIFELRWHAGATWTIPMVLLWSGTWHRSWVHTHLNQCHFWGFGGIGSVRSQLCQSGIVFKSVWRGAQCHFRSPKSSRFSCCCGRWGGAANPNVIRTLTDSGLFLCHSRFRDLEIGLVITQSIGFGVERHAPLPLVLTPRSFGVPIWPRLECAIWSSHRRRVCDGSMSLNYRVFHSAISVLSRLKPRSGVISCALVWHHAGCGSSAWCHVASRLPC